jgi:hypothetical protein
MLSNHVWFYLGLAVLLWLDHDHVIYINEQFAIKVCFQELLLVTDNLLREKEINTLWLEQIL